MCASAFSCSLYMRICSFASCPNCFFHNLAYGSCRAPASALCVASAMAATQWKRSSIFILLSTRHTVVFDVVTCVKKFLRVFPRWITIAMSPVDRTYDPVCTLYLTPLSVHVRYCRRQVFVDDRDVAFLESDLNWLKCVVFVTRHKRNCGRALSHHISFFKFCVCRQENPWAYFAMECVVLKKPQSVFRDYTFITIGLTWTWWKLSTMIKYYLHGA